MMQTREQQRRWVILACIPRVVPDGEASPPATDFSFQCKAPPEPCCLTVPRCMAPDPKDIENHPYVAAVSDHGRFLLYATLGNDDLVPGEPPFVDRFHSEPLGLVVVHQGYRPQAYFLCETATSRPSRPRASRTTTPTPTAPSSIPATSASSATSRSSPGSSLTTLSFPWLSSSGPRPAKTTPPSSGTRRGPTVGTSGTTTLLLLTGSGAATA